MNEYYLNLAQDYMKKAQEMQESVRGGIFNMDRDRSCMAYAAEYSEQAQRYMELAKNG